MINAVLRGNVNFDLRTISELETFECYEYLLKISRTKNKTEQMVRKEKEPLNIIKIWNTVCLGDTTSSEEYTLP